MKPAILLLAIGSTDCSADSLREVLTTSFRADFKLEIKTITEANYPLDVLGKSLGESDASIVFLSLSRDLLTRAADLLKSVRVKAPEVPIILAIDGGCQPESILELLMHGASDFVTPPLTAVDVVPRVWRLLKQTRQQERPAHRLKQKLGLNRLIGESSAFANEVKKFPKVARCDANVLLLGETGTGKEMCARAIHYLSPRADKPFVPVNCGAIPVELVENELFGHEREAFTGAASSRFGLIQEAAGGTLFMDEIDCLPLIAQVKLLRFLQEKEYRPLGSMKPRQADLRVIAATNTDIEEAVKNGKVRPDLYYRLNVISLVLPPLRDRREDIPLLARHFLIKYRDEFDRRISGFSEPAMQMLLAHEWPGNVRELEHVVERAIVMSEGEIIDGEAICLPQPASSASGPSFQEMKGKMVAQFERNYLNHVLRLHHGNISRAALAAQKDPRALRQLIRKHKINVELYKHG